jgi:hypothetical protein
VYICYEHSRDASGKIVLTEIKLSSSNTSFKIAFFQAREKMLFDLIKPLLKTPPISVRSYDEKTNVWSYLNGTGEQVLTNINAICSPLGGVTLLEVPQLAEQAAQGTIRLNPRAQQMKAEEFFYNHGTPTSMSALTKEQIALKLYEILECGIIPDKAQLKILYRKAALKFHPDRNNGDGRKMSELNMLWQMYNT